MREPGPGQLLGLRPLLGPGGDQELPHGAGRGVPDGPNGGEASIAGRQGRGPGMQGLPPVGGEGLQDPDPAQRHHHCPGGGQEGRPGGSGGAIRELQGGAIDGGGDGGLLLKKLDLDLFREKLLDKLGADWGRPTPELLQAQTTAEEAKAKHQARQAKGRMLEPITPPFSAWPNEVRVAIETGVFEPTTAWRDFSMDDLTSLTDLEAKAVISLGRNPFPAALLTDLPDLTGIPMPKAGGSGVARPAADCPDIQPTIPPASGSGATSSGAEGPDKPSATPVGLDTQDPEVQLAVLRWMMSKRVGEVRIFAGRWVRRPGPVHVPDWANNLTRVNPVALEKGTHPRSHQVGGLPWARYSVEELYQQARAGDRPYPEDLRSIFWAAPHDPEEDFHWTRQISSWTLPGPLKMFGHSFTLRHLWGVWESLPLLQGLRQRGPKNKAQNQIPSGDLSTGPWARSSRPGPSSRTPRRR